jgi:leucyl aminopeptidase (aminopeptidase T)
MRDPRLAKLASVLVNYSVGVKKGNLVRIRGAHGSEPLMLEIQREIKLSWKKPSKTSSNTATNRSSNS